MQKGTNWNEEREEQNEESEEQKRRTEEQSCRQGERVKGMKQYRLAWFFAMHSMQPLKFNATGNVLRVGVKCKTVWYILDILHNITQPFSGQRIWQSMILWNSGTEFEFWWKLHSFGMRKDTADYMVVTS